MRKIEEMENQLRSLVDNLHDIKDEIRDLKDKIKFEKSKDHIGKVKKLLKKLGFKNKTKFRFVEFEAKNSRIWAHNSIFVFEENEWDYFKYPDNDAGDLDRCKYRESLLDPVSIYQYRGGRDIETIFLNQIALCPFSKREFVCNDNEISAPWEGYLTGRDADILVFVSFLEKLIKEKSKGNVFWNSDVIRRSRDWIGKSKKQFAEFYRDTNDYKAKEYLESMWPTKSKEDEIAIKKAIQRNQRKRGEFDKVKESLIEIRQESQRMSTRSNSRYLYLMKDEHLGCHKIGVSINPEHREATLAAQKPSVKLVGQWEGLSDNEKLWHGYFADHRVRGEWFKLTKAQVRFMVYHCLKNQGPPLVECAAS